MRLLILLAALSIPVGAAQAQTAMVVKVRGLELDSPGGAATALQRANAASRRFCQQDVGALDVTTLTCRRDMVQRFVRKLNARNVSRLEAWSPLQLAAGPPGDGPALP